MRPVAALPLRPAAAGAARRGALLLVGSAYVLAWSLWAPLLGRDLGNVAILPPDFLVLALAGGLMPSAGALAWRLAGLRVPASARDGLAPPRPFSPWLAGALVIVPLMTLAGAGIQAALGQPFSLGDISSRLVIGAMWPLMAAVGEEFCWRGGVLPFLRPRFGFLRSALITGLAWGFWHLPADWIGLKSQGAWFVPQFLLQGPVLLTAHSVIMTWIWAKTGGRTLPAIVYHFGITASAIILGNQVKLEGSSAFLGSLAATAVVLCAAGAAGTSLARRDAAQRAASTPSLRRPS